MNKKSPIQWTPKQKQVAELLQKGLSNTEISVKLGVAKSLVTKVNKVLKKGYTPSQEAYSTEKIAVNKIAYSNQPGERSQNVKAQEQIQATATSVEGATLAKLVPEVVVIPLTHIMINARLFLVERLGWSPDEKWENIIDTVFYHYFKSCGVILQSYYEENNPPKV